MAPSRAQPGALCREVLWSCFPQHELVVTAESGGRAALTVLEVRVDDVNDNPPTFLLPDQRLTIVEEDDRDLPAIIAKVGRWRQVWRTLGVGMKVCV